MLPSSRRVTRKMFDSVIKSGRTAHSPHFSLRKGLLNRKEEPSRFSVVVSGAVAKKAVDRNLLKRRVRAVFKKCIEGALPGFGVAVFAKKGAPGLTYKEIEVEVYQLISNSGILSE